MHRHILKMAALAAVLVSTAAAADSRVLAIGNWGQVWGTWIWYTQVGPGVAMPALITFHADGTITGVDSSSAVPNTTANESPLQGVWERTGWQSIGGTSLLFMTDPQTGVLVALGRSRSSLTFSGDFNQFQGTMYFETVGCPAGPPSCPDPLASSTKWMPMPGMPPNGFPVNGTRLQRIPTGPLPQ